MTRKAMKKSAKAVQPTKSASKPDPLTGAELTRAVCDPTIRHAYTAADYCKHFGELDVGEAISELRKHTKAIHEGETKGIEATLAAQAEALDAIFAHLARRASVNAGEYLGAMETYLKLALRAQSQCRATLETLAAIKNPPVVFAKQANIANNQQVNNGNAIPAPRAERNQNRPTELLEASRAKPEWMDAGTTRAATPSDPAMATVDKINRPQDA